MPRTSSTISNGGNLVHRAHLGPFTGVAENPSRLTSREAAFPGTFRLFLSMAAEDPFRPGERHFTSKRILRGMRTFPACCSVSR